MITKQYKVSVIGDGSIAFPYMPKYSDYIGSNGGKWEQIKNNDHYFYIRVKGEKFIHTYLLSQDDVKEML